MEKFEADKPNSFWKIILIFRKEYVLVHYRFGHPAISQFTVFSQLLLFPLLMLTKGWKLHKLIKLTTSFNFDASYGLNRMLMSKNVNIDVRKDSP